MNQQFENGIDKKSVPGCLGRMVDLFDLSTGNRLLTDQLHGDGSPLSRNQSHGGRISRFSDLIEHKVMSSDPTHSSSLNGTPMKMLIAHEMSKEIHESPQSCSPSLVFKLMGVDTGPQELLDRGSQRGRQRGHSRSLSGSSLNTTTWQQEQKEYKDIYQIWKQPQKGSSGRDKTMLTMSQHGETVNEKKMALVRQKFLEAKQLATDEKLRQSKQFQDALDVLSSNKDLFIRFLQEPNSLLAQHLRDLHLHSLPPSTTEPTRITVLRPSKMVNSNNIARLTKKSENSTTMTAFTSEVLGWGKTDDNQSTRIIVLKPSSGHIGEQNPPKSEHGQQMDENFAVVSRVETSLSSAVSNGYIADESSFSKSDNEYLNGKLSDSEIVSPTSRHSWDYINKFDSLHSCSSFSHASNIPGPSFCEAKKRLSERWAMASTETNDVQKLAQRNSSCTLGEMLAISDIKNPAESHEEGFSKKELEPRASALSNARESNEDDNVVNSHRNLLKSKSVPVSSTVFGGRLDTEVSKSGVGEKDGFKDNLETKILTRKLSFKEKVSSLFFSINKITDKENSRFVQSSGKISGNSLQHDHQAIKNQENLSKYLPCSDSISLGLNSDAPSSEKSAQPRSTSDNQEQPSPISVLEAPFVDHETANLDSSEGAKLAVHPNKCRQVDKSPPIGSVSRVLSWESSCGETRASHELENTIHRSSEEEEEAEWFFFVQTLLSLAGLDNVVQLSSVFARCDSSESPLDLSLRDKYVDLNDKELLMHETNWRKRSTRKLVFDLVNAALVEIIPCITQIDSSESLVNLVWAWIKKWRSSEVVGSVSVEEDDDSLVDVMVRNEVAGNGFVESFVPLEIELLVKEIEAHLAEEIVREAVVELTGSSPSCLFGMEEETHSKCEDD